MKKIESFQIDHNKLLRGVYVSRKDAVGKETVTTFDIRMKEPNREPVMSIAGMHTLEHLGATFLRSHETRSSEIIYFGPMGCRTGFYLIVAGLRDSRSVLPLVTEMFEFIAAYEGDIPGATAVECGNYSDQDLRDAKKEAALFKEQVLDCITDSNLVYPV